MKKLRSLAVIAVLFSLFALTSIVTEAHAGSKAPVIQFIPPIRPAEWKVGTWQSVTFKAYGLAGTTINVVLQNPATLVGNSIAFGTLEEDGRQTISFIVPAGTLPGKYNLIVSDSEVDSDGNAIYAIAYKIITVYP